MGIRFYCPNGHKLNVKEFQAGRKGICPYCGARIQIPTESTRQPSKKKKKRGAKRREGMTAGAPGSGAGGGPPGLAFGPGAARAARLPDSGPAAADTVESLAAEPPHQGPVDDAPFGFPSMIPSPLPSPEVGLPNPLPVPAGVAPLVLPTSVPAEPALPASPAVTDPLTEAGDAVWYVRPASGGQFGPASGEVMRSWLGQGRVGADSLVWREGWPDWRQAAKVFPQLGAGRPDPPLPLGKSTAGEVATTGAVAARSRRANSRRESKRTQTLVLILLIFALIILSGLLVWVLSG